MADRAAKRTICASHLLDKVTDVHAHVGASIGAYARHEFPYCQSLEGLYYRHLANRVDYGVVFPFSADLYFDIPTLARLGLMIPSDQPLSATPYERENRLLFTEVFTFCPEYRARFLPFVCADPERDIPGQIDALQALELEFPIYGIKISAVGCQSRLAGLLGVGQPLLTFAAERDLPLLFHVTVHPQEHYSQVSDALKIAERHPELRFCLAHCLGFDQACLERAAAAPNVWVDTSALKIQVQLAHENSLITALPADRFDWPYDDHRQIMRQLLEHYPETIVWGSDSPAYSYICRRQQAPGVVTEFRLKANYEDERAALDALPEIARRQASSTNTIAFLFGQNAVHQ